MMKLDDLPTPALVLDIGILRRNLARMQAAIDRHAGVVLRPHMKTAKSVAVAELAAPGHGPITVSTLAEAEYFAAAGYRDQVYAVGISPQKLDRVAAMNAAGAAIKIITDDLDTARAIAAHPGPHYALIEVDVGESRGGVTPESPELLAIGAALRPCLAGVLAHAGHSYAGRSIDQMRAIAETERSGITRAADRLREEGHSIAIVSMGSSPTALHAETLRGVTEVRAGVYMFGGLFQAEIGTHAIGDIAVTVLATVIGRKPERDAVLVDAGGLALSKDRSTANAPRDYGFGLVLDIGGKPGLGDVTITRTHQEHGEAHPLALPVGARLRIAPNHSCMTCAAYDRYYLVDGSDTVIGEWQRVNGW